MEECEIKVELPPALHRRLGDLRKLGLDAQSICVRALQEEVAIAQLLRQTGREA